MHLDTPGKALVVPNGFRKEGWELPAPLKGGMTRMTLTYPDHWFWRCHAMDYTLLASPNFIKSRSPKDSTRRQGTARQSPFASCCSRWGGVDFLDQMDDFNWKFHGKHPNMAFLSSMVYSSEIVAFQGGIAWAYINGFADHHTWRYLGCRDLSRYFGIWDG